jgi:hypothetical protein
MLAAYTTIRVAGLIQAVTPIDRLRGMKALNGGAGATEIPWLTLTGCIAVIGLLVLLVVVNRNSARRKNERITREFEHNADKVGLTAAEQRLMTAIARHSGIEDITLIFSNHEAFSRGASKLMQDHFASGDSIEDRRNLKAAVELIYQKLGIVSSAPASSDVISRLNTRQVPVGKTVYIVQRGNNSQEETETVVAANKHDGIVLKVSGEMAAGTVVGELWQIRYHLGPSAWEFQSSVTELHEGLVTLAHRDMARFTNRRRFLRVPVRYKALVANYTLSPGSLALDKATPKFVSAVVTEIAGPGMRLETSLAMTPGDKLLIVVSFENGEVIRNMAEVKHVQSTRTGWSVAVELVTLSDAEVGTLVRLTNIAAKNLETDQKAGQAANPVIAGKA